MSGDTDRRSVLALDQGGHAGRALVFDAAGGAVAHAAVTVRTRIDGDRVEQDPEALVDSLREAAVRVLAEAGPVHAAGLATQRASIVCWDREAGTALTPVISWQDRRAAERLAPLEPRAGRIAHLTGLRLSPHYGASKLAWCLEHVPAVRRAARDGRLLAGPLASFLLFRLLAERPACADPANASRTLLYDRHRHDWSDELIQAFGLQRTYLPGLTPSRHNFGHLTFEGARAPLTVCTGDQSAALFAGGVPEPGCVVVNLGTGAFLHQAIKDPAPPGELLAGLAWRGAALTVHTLEGTVNGAGAALEWLAEDLGLAAEALQRLLPEALAINEEPPLFLNGVGGLGSPWWRPAFTSRFIGGGDVYHRAAAVIESVAFLVTRNLEQMRAQGFPVRRLHVGGGLSQLDGLCHRLASLSGLPVERLRFPEATARGLAWLVAGRPAAWAENAHADRFRSLPDAPLERRYRRWSRAMAVRAR